MIATLIKKEIRQHLLASMAVVSLTALVTSILVARALRDSGGLMQVGVQVCTFFAPLYCLYAVHRLFTLEYRDRTDEFVAALPVSLRALTSIKTLIGVVVTAGFSVFIVGAIAASIGARELVGSDWVMQVALQVAAYSFAWFGVGAGIAHLGRYSHAAWLLLFICAVTLWSLDPENYGVLWFGVVADRVEMTRYAPPWAEIAGAMFWGAGGITMAYLLAGHQGGSLVRRWFTQVSGRERTATVVFVFGVGLASTVVVAFFGLQGPGLGGLPSVNEGPVHIAASSDSELWAVGRSLDRSLAGFGKVVGVENWPDVILTLHRGRDKRRPVEADRSHALLLLSVDLGAGSAAIIRGALREVVAQRSRGIIHKTDYKGWILAGFAQSWLARAGQSTLVYERRAAWAAREGVSEAEMRSWARLEARFGADIAEAVAWVGLRAVQRLKGTEGLDRLLRDTLVGRRPRNSIGLLWERISSQGGPEAAIQGALGVSWTTFVDLWQAELASSLGEHERVIEGMAPPPDCELSSPTDPDSGLGLSWTCGTSDLRSGAELLWSTTSPLADFPKRNSRVRRVSLKGRRFGQSPIAADRRARVVAAISVPVDELEGHVISGWVEVPTR